MHSRRQPIIKLLVDPWVISNYAQSTQYFPKSKSTYEVAHDYIDFEIFRRKGLVLAKISTDKKI